MKILLTTTCAAALLGAGLLGAADQNAVTTSKDVTQETKTVTNQGTTTIKNETLYGKVEGYELNKSIKVSEPGKASSSKTFDLSAKNQTLHMPSNINVGDWVKVHQYTANNGHKTLTIQRTSQRSSNS